MSSKYNTAMTRPAAKTVQQRHQAKKHSTQHTIFFGHYIYIYADNIVIRINCVSREFLARSLEHRAPIEPIKSSLY